MEMYVPFFINFMQSMLAPVRFAYAVPTMLMCHTSWPIIAMMPPT